jgi:hypothetical protein
VLGLPDEPAPVLRQLQPAHHGRVDDGRGELSRLLAPLARVWRWPPLRLLPRRAALLLAELAVALALPAAVAALRELAPPVLPERRLAVARVRRAAALRARAAVLGRVPAVATLAVAGGLLLALLTLLAAELVTLALALVPRPVLLLRRLLARPLAARVALVARRGDRRRIPGPELGPGLAPRVGALVAALVAALVGGLDVRRRRVGKSGRRARLARLDGRVLRRPARLRTAERGFGRRLDVAGRLAAAPRARRAHARLAGFGGRLLGPRRFGERRLARRLRGRAAGFRGRRVLSRGRTVGRRGTGRHAARARARGTRRSRLGGRRLVLAGGGVGRDGGTREIVAVGVQVPGVRRRGAGVGGGAPDGAATFGHAGGRKK